MALGAGCCPRRACSRRCWLRGLCEYFSERRSEPPLSLPKLRTPVSDAPASAADLVELMMRVTLGTALTENLKWSRKEARFVYAETGPRPASVERGTAKQYGWMRLI